MEDNIRIAIGDLLKEWSNLEPGRCKVSLDPDEGDSVEILWGEYKHETGVYWFDNDIDELILQQAIMDSLIARHWAFIINGDEICKRYDFSVHIVTKINRYKSDGSHLTLVLLQAYIKALNAEKGQD